MFGNKNSRSSGQTVVDTLIGAQVVIRGDLVFSGGLYVEGRILGKVVAEDGAPATLTLSEHGSIEGEVRAPVVIINGQLIGDVHAAERVELASKARVQGNVHYQVVEMNAGAQLDRAPDPRRQPGGAGAAGSASRGRRRRRAAARA